MAGTDLQKMEKSALHAKLKEARAELFKLGQQAVTAKVDKTHQFREHRKTIARLLTEINARRHRDAGTFEKRAAAAAKRSMAAGNGSSARGASAPAAKTAAKPASKASAKKA
jgi:ribosomal protein L29